MISGGCFCGRVRYEIRGVPFNATLCHCADCRRATGAPAVAWFSCRPADLIYIGKQPGTFASSPGVTRAFCPACGTALTYARADLPDEIDVTTGSLENPSTVPPQDHTQHRHRVAWADELGELPVFPGARE